MVPVAYGRTAALAGVAAEKGGVDPRLAPAAHEFEASLMQELLKPMERDPLFSSSSSGGLLGSDAGAGTWSSLGAQSLAKAISDAGGLGLAKEMISEVEAEAKATQAGTTQAGGGRLEPLRGEHDLSSWSIVRRLP